MNIKRPTTISPQQLRSTYMERVYNENPALYWRIVRGLTNPTVSIAEYFYCKILLNRGIALYG